GKGPGAGPGEGPGVGELVDVGLDVAEHIGEDTALGTAAGAAAPGAALFNMRKEMGDANDPVKQREGAAGGLQKHDTYDSRYAASFDLYNRLWNSAGVGTVDQFCTALTNYYNRNPVKSQAEADALNQLASLLDPKQGGSQAKLGAFLDAMSAEQDRR